jgi:hypothetical protein
LACSKVVVVVVVVGVVTRERRVNVNVNVSDVDDGRTQAVAHDTIRASKRSVLILLTGERERDTS